MRVKDVLEVGSTLIVAAVAVIMAQAYLRGVDGSGGETNDFESARVIPDWRDENARGVRTGAAEPTVVITEFVDLECPYCARLAPTIDSMLVAFPDDVALVVHHLPLSIHELAVPAAIAAECADRQGRFWPMYRALLSQQSSLASASWESFAVQAGVVDRSAFADCVALPADSFPRIAYGRDLASRSGVSGTPTLWVNGRVIQPTFELIESLIESGSP